MGTFFLTESVPEVLEFRPANWQEKYLSGQSCSEEVHPGDSVALKKDASELRKSQAVTWVLSVPYFLLIAGKLLLLTIMFWNP